MLSIGRLVPLLNTDQLGELHTHPQAERVCESHAHIVAILHICKLNDKDGENMLKKVDRLLKQCKGKTTIKKFEDMLVRLTGMVKYDFDIFMRGNAIPYRVTVAAGVTKEEWEATPDEGFDIQVEHEDPDKLGRLAFDEVMKTKKGTDTTFTFIDYESKTIKLRIKGDDYHRPIFIAHFRGRWNGAMDDFRRDMEHNSKKEDWRKSL